MTWLGTSGCAAVLAGLLAAVGPTARAQQVDPSRPEVTVLDPTGQLMFTLGGAEYALEFRELAWPKVGEALLSAKPDANAVRFGRLNRGLLEPIDRVSITVRAFDSTRVDFDVAWREDDHDFRFEIMRAPEVRRLHTAIVLGAPSVLPKVAPELLEDAAREDDYVVCAIGSPGSGLPGQKRVAASIERLVASERADQVLILGDLLMPDGIASRDDALLRERFEAVYPSSRLMLPFRLVLGAAERRGSDSALFSYCSTNLRLSVDVGAGVIRDRAGDVVIELLTCDSPAAAMPVVHPLARRTRSLIAQRLSETHTGWLVGASYDSLHGHGDAADSPGAREFVRVIEPVVAQHPVDMWLSGASRSLELCRDASGTLHVGCGGGGGPEIARSIEWAGDTLFAATGGGSVWLRFRGDQCRITLRDADGKPLFVHDETRRPR